MLYESFSWKNAVSQIDPGSLWEGPWTLRASTIINRMTKHPPEGFRNISENWPWNWSVWGGFGPKILNFLMLAHVLPAARPRGTQNMTIRADGAKHSPSAHAVRSTEGRKFGFQRKFVILSGAGQYPHSITWSFRICGIGTIRNTFELSFSALGSEFGFQSTSKLLRKWYFLGSEKSTFSWKNEVSQIDPGSL